MFCFSKGHLLGLMFLLELFITNTLKGNANKLLDFFYESKEKNVSDFGFH